MRWNSMPMPYRRYFLHFRSGEILHNIMSPSNGSQQEKVKERPLQVHLLATWSSGSTFLTKLLSHYPGVFLRWAGIGRELVTWPHCSPLIGLFRSFEPLVTFNTYNALEDRWAVIGWSQRSPLIGWPGTSTTPGSCSRTCTSATTAPAAGAGSSLTSSATQVWQFQYCVCI